MTSIDARVSSDQPRSHRLLPLVVWGATALALVILLVSGEADAIVAALTRARANWADVVVLLAVGLALPLVHAQRWRVMLQAIGEDVPLRGALDITVTSTMVNYAAPGYLWSPTKGLLARQAHGIGFGRTLPTLAAEQGLDALALVLGTAVGLALAGPDSATSLADGLDAPSVSWLLLAALVGTLLVSLTVLAARRYAGRFLRSLATSARMLAEARRQRFTILGLTLARWVLDVTAVWLALRGVEVTPGPGEVIVLANLPLLVGQLSPMPGGVGFREGTMAALAGALGLTVSAILAAAVLHRALLLLALPLTLIAVRLPRRSAR